MFLNHAFADLISFEIGKASITANELVYVGNSSYKLSHLIWETKDSPILTVGYSNYISENVSFNLSSQFSLIDSISVMDDYDWLKNDPNNWSHWSHHEDTNLDEASGLDLNLEFDFLNLNEAKFSLLAGYKSDTWAWKSRGGSYIYSSDSGFRDLSGDFTAGSPAIDYRQEYSSFYYGINIGQSFEDFSFSFQFIKSNSVSLLATDIHHARDLVFIDYIENGKMHVYKYNVNYQLGEGSKVYLSYELQQYLEARGYTGYSTYSTGEYLGRCSGNCAGADNTSSTISLGISIAY